MYQFIQELKSILTFTNATPFKSKTNTYFCHYCNNFTNGFKDAEALRTHTRTVHAADRTKKFEFTLRPHWVNETVKFDTDNLLCTVCCIPIKSWTEMFDHLKTTHKILLDQAYTRAIPYTLKSDLKCALCKEAFTYYMQLDYHMNSHYNNYICDDCGDMFLSLYRLKLHLKIHDTGRFACSICGKVFALHKYKKKHEELVHKQLPKFKCWYCEERFHGEYIRHLHLLDKHKEKVKTIICELCGKTFTWRAYYIKHKRLKHVPDPNKHVCHECGKKFFVRFELKEHLLKHTGEKHFPCRICNKKYVSSGSLKHHLNWHKKNDGLNTS